eukprot:6177322-Pleurochrysis_carterae.AAC.1
MARGPTPRPGLGGCNIAAASPPRSLSIPQLALHPASAPRVDQNQQLLQLPPLRPRCVEDHKTAPVAGIISRAPRCEGHAMWRDADEYFLLCSGLTGYVPTRRSFTPVGTCRLEVVGVNVLARGSYPHASPCRDVLNCRAAFLSDTRARTPERGSETY